MPKTTKTTRTTRVKTARVSAGKEALGYKRNLVASGSAMFIGVTAPNLPDPEELAKYEKIIPGGAERILELAERQFEQESALTSRQLETSARTTRIKQFIVFVLALTGLALGSALLLQGSELAGLIVIIVDAIALISVKPYESKRLN